MAYSRTGISSQAGEQTHWQPWRWAGWSFSFLAPFQADRPQERPRPVLFLAVTERHRGTLSHETLPSEMRHASKGLSHTRGDTCSEDVICSEEVTCFSPQR